MTEDTNVAAFFAEARRLGVDVQIGYGEDTGSEGRYNTAVYVSGKDGSVLNKYRKVHLPGTVEPFDLDPNTTNQLEKRYFLPGNLGFNAFRATSLKEECGGSSPIVGQLICNDRRWAEGWRCYGLQGVEILCCGYVSYSSRPVPEGLMGRTPPRTHRNCGEAIRLSPGRRHTKKQWRVVHFQKLRHVADEQFHHKRKSARYQAKLANPQLSYKRTHIPTPVRQC